MYGRGAGGGAGGFLGLRETRARSAGSAGRAPPAHAPLRRTALAPHGADAPPLYERARRGGGSSLLVPSGTKRGLDEYFGEDEIELLRSQTQSFATYIMTSMHLAGLDRRYGRLESEAARVQSTLSESGDGSSVDYELMHSLRSVDTGPLQLVLDSSGDDADDAAGSSVDAFTRLSAALAEVARSSATTFLAGVPVSETSAPFQFLLGPTDPSEWIRELVGESGRLLTPSPTAFLYLTLLDPYAYGISSQRAIMTFIASMLVRAEIRENSDAGDEPTTNVDDFISRESVHSLLRTDSVDEAELGRLRRAVEHMPSFVAFMECMRAHSASEAPKNNPAFHATYSVLKATYLLHFVCSWLGAEITKGIKREAAEAAQRPRAQASAYRYIVSESNREMLHQARTRLDAAARRLPVAAAPGGPPPARSRHSSRTRKDALQACADCVLAIVDASKKATHVEHASRATEAHDRAPDRAFGKAATTRRTAAEYDAAHAHLRRVTGEIRTQEADDDPIAELNDADAWRLLAHVGTTAANALIMRSVYDMTVRSMSLGEAEAFVETHNLIDNNNNAAAELRYLASAMEFYLMFLAHAERSAGGSAPPPQASRRAYRLSSAVFFTYRLHDFLRQMYRMPRASNDEPTIVTMLRGAGWAQAKPESGVSAQAVFNKVFESLTYMLAHCTLYCHSLIGDMSRTTRLVHHIHKTRRHNMQLMGILQRTALHTVKECHPFMHAEETQMTLPAAVAASMLPTMRSAPLEWGPADLVFRKEIDVGGGADPVDTSDARYLLRAVVGESAFARLLHEQRSSINLIQKIKSGDSTKADIAAVAEAVRRLGAGAT